MITLLLTFLLVSAGRGQSVTPRKPGKIVCYVNHLSYHRPGNESFTFADIPLDKCTHYIYAFVDFDRVFKTQPNTPLLTRIVQGTKPNGLKKFGELKKRGAKTSFLMSIGGWTDKNGIEFSRNVASKENCVNLANNLIRNLKKYKLTGVDLAWMWPDQKDKINFVEFIKELKKSFETEGKQYEISVTVPIIPSKLIGFDILEICKNVDFINVMTYDLSGFWSGDGTYRRNSFNVKTLTREVYDVNSGVQTWLDGGCSSDKIVLGIPTFVTDNEQNYFVDKEPYYADCQKIEKLVANWNREYYDMPYDLKGTDTLRFENLRSILAKLEFIKANNLNGVALFSLDTDDFKGTCGKEYPLLNHVVDKFLVTGLSKP